MFIIESYSTAVVFCVITMICWGSWANTQKLAAAQWRFELFYWDYVIGILAMALVIGFTLGSTGAGGRPLVADLGQASNANILSATIGGIIFNAANILLGAAIAIAGMSVAFPVGIGLALVVGVIVNYVNLPVGNGFLITAGVLFVVLAILLNARAYHKLAANSASTPAKGILLSVISGALMGLFYRYVAGSMFNDFTVPEPGKLSPYSAVLVFSAGILLSNLVFNTALMRRPFVGTPVAYSDYLKGSMRSHLTGLAGGAIWCIGMSFSIIASGKAGPAISYGLGQGATVIAAIWGIFIWKEFRNAPPGTNTILYGMLFCYVVGLILIIAAR